MDPFSLKILMNHSLAKAAARDVTAGYIRSSDDLLRTQVERVAAFLVGQLWPAKAGLRSVA